MTRTYSEIRDAVFEVMSSVMTATPLGSQASIDQLGDTRRQLVGRCAEQIADEIVMMHDNAHYELPSIRHDRNENDYSEPGKYDDNSEIPAPIMSSSDTDGEKGLFL